MSTFTAWTKLDRKDPARRKGYKYRTTTEVVYQSELLFGWCEKIVTSSGGYITLDPMLGLLTAAEGYCWNGADGPTFDTANTMLGSLIHDECYQLFREEKVDRRGHRDIADMLLRRICIEQGMSEWRANLWTWAVLTFGKRSAGG